MSGRDKREAWADFWRENRGQDGGGCLAGAGSEIGIAQAALWRDFARSLPKNAKVLDLGTGDGVVLRQLGQARPDLKLTGVDSAPSLPAARGKMRLIADVAMEALPFADASFAAVVSQFGYEYGDTANVAVEAARVLAPAGSLQLLVHHRSGPVVRHNRARAAALRWAVFDNGLLDKARGLANARRSLPLPTPPAFREAIGEAARMHPGQDVAAEIAQAVLQTLSLPPAQSLAALADLERKAVGELARLDALDAAARDADGIGVMADELRAAGFAEVTVDAVYNRIGEAFGWRVAARR